MRDLGNLGSCSLLRESILSSPLNPSLLLLSFLITKSSHGFFYPLIFFFIQKNGLSLAKQRWMTPNMFFRVMGTDFPQICCMSKCKIFKFAE